MSPPTAESLFYDKGRIDKKEVSPVVMSVDPRIIISTRKFLTAKRLEGKKRRASQLHPQLIVIEGNYYCIDGHHKIRRAFDSGDGFIQCKVYSTQNTRVAAAVLGMASGLISTLGIQR